MTAAKCSIEGERMGLAGRQGRGKLQMFVDSWLYEAWASINSLFLCRPAVASVKWTAFLGGLCTPGTSGIVVSSVELDGAHVFHAEGGLPRFQQ